DTESLLAMLSGLGLRMDYQWVVKSGSGKGYHIWLKAPGLFADKNAGREQRHSKAGGTIDLRFDGHYTILPPSKHPSGGTYEFLHGQPETPLALVAPENVLEAFNQVTIAPELKTPPAPPKSPVLKKA